MLARRCCFVLEISDRRGRELIWYPQFQSSGLAMSVSVVLADDADVLRAAIRGLLHEHPDIELVAETSNFDDTMRIARDIEPDVILVDLHMVRKTPANRTWILPPENSRLLAMSLATGPETQILAANLGAVALLDKMRLADELIPMILSVASEKAKHATAG